MKKLNLAVIFGGKSGEHEISLSSAKAIIQALNKEKYNIIPIAIAKNGRWLLGEKGKKYLRINSEKSKKVSSSIKISGNLTALKEKNFTDYAKGKISEKIDLVLPILHGPNGEDGKIQGMLEMLSLPYVFSGVLTHALAMNKPKAKIIAKQFEIPVASDLILKKIDSFKIKDILKNISLPVVIKPSELGSSVGVSIAKTPKKLEEGIKKAFSYGEEILLEKYIKGRELTVTVMGNANPQALAITEIIPLISDFYDYKAKYKKGGSKHICPAKLPEKTKKKIKKAALKIFKAFNCWDLARIDFMLDEKENKFYFIEINTIPGMTATSLAPEAAALAGMKFSQFLDVLIEGALKRNKLK